MRYKYSEIPLFKGDNNYPFKNMKIWECVEMEGRFIKKAQAYAHSYARNVGKRFKTRTVDDVLYVWRVPRVDGDIKPIWSNQTKDMKTL